MNINKHILLRQLKEVSSLPLFFCLSIILFVPHNVYSNASSQAAKQSVKHSKTKQDRPDSQFKVKLKATIAKAEKSFNDEFHAEVWLFEQAKRLEKIAPHIPENERFLILRLVHREASKFNLDPMMVLALINIESHFDQYAISSAGALGLMQVMPFWKNEIGKPSDNLNEIETNLRYGCAILSQYLKREKNNSTMALGRYNGSRGQYWYPERVYKAMRKVWRP
jgi:soluble lytic murein transglycosylase-like protein